MKWLCELGAVSVLASCSCNVDMPKVVPTSFDTMTIEKKDIVIPVKFSAKLRGQSDVTISPQVSGQLMKIAVNEGQQVNKGDVLFVIDSRNAQLDLEAAQANLQAAEAQAYLADVFPEWDQNSDDVRRFMAAVSRKIRK